MTSTKFNVLAGLRKMEEDEDDEDDDELAQGNNGADKLTDEAPGTDDSNVENSLMDPPKPLRSILKKRAAPESATEDEPACKPEGESDIDVLPKKPNFGGSITAALKKITSVKELIPEKNSNEPVPSAFIQEMEKQKDIQLAPGAYGMPSRDPVLEGIEMMWGDQNEKPEPDSFFLREQRRLKDRKIKRPYERKPKPKVVKTPVEELEEECVILITNLPFKVTNQSLVLVLGVWPKDGYDGVRMIYDRTGLPAGHAYIILERHTDMMAVIRMTGVEVEGRKIKVMMSTHEALARDWKVTKEALVKMDLSRVIRVSQLPFVLKKSELIKTIKDVTFKEDDIYWKPLKANQQNSGRGYVVLSSSSEAKKVTDKTYDVLRRTIEVRQVHPSELMKFCDQCKMKIDENHLLTDPLPENISETVENDLPAAPAADKPKPSPKKATHEGPTNFVVMEDLDNVTIEPHHSSDDAAPSPPRQRSPPERRRYERERTERIQPTPVPRKKKRRRRKRKGKTNNKPVDMDLAESKSEESEEDNDDDDASSVKSDSPEVITRPPPSTGRSNSRQPPGDSLSLQRPPFPLTVYVRMYNVPDKATTKDIRNFFSPLLPAKIAHNIGYDIYDVQFYNPDDAWKAMGKHFLLIRKNVINLEMLPGPPTPLPPRPENYRIPLPISMKKKKKGGSDKIRHDMGPGMHVGPPMGHMLMGEPLPPGVIPVSGHGNMGMGPMVHEIRPGMLHRDIRPGPPIMIGPGPGPPMMFGPGPGPMIMDIGPRPIFVGGRPGPHDMEPRQMMIEMGPRPMHPDMGPRPMHPDMGPRPMHPDMGPRPMHPDMGPRPMHPDMGPRPMHPDMGPRPMHPDMGPRSMPPGPGFMHPDMGPQPFPQDLGPRPFLPMGPHPFPPDMGPRPLPPMMPNFSPGMGNPDMECSSRTRGAIDPKNMPPPMHKKGSSYKKDRSDEILPARIKDDKIEPQKEYIPVPPLPQDFTTYKVPEFKSDTPVGQATITPMQGYFCQLCNKFYSSRKSAKVTHCKSKGHYDKLRQFLQEKKRLRKLAETSA